MMVFQYLRELFGENPRSELDYSNDLELIVAIILSAQCTDKRVNMVTPVLFDRYKTIQDYATADPAEIEKLIYSIGFYHNKARNIIALCKILHDKGLTLVDICNQDPDTAVDRLSKLPGIGRKTASVFAAEYCGIPAVAVDTHVIRVANRLGFTTNSDPVKIEADLKQIFPRENWRLYHHYLVLFGRYHCTARNPKCEDCKIKNHCRHRTSVL